MSIGLAVYLHNSRQTVPILYNGPPYHKNCPFPWGIWNPSNTLFLGHTRVTPQPKRHLDRFSLFGRVHGTASLYFAVGRGRPFPKELPFPWRDLDPHPQSPYRTNMVPWPIRVLNRNSIWIGSPILQGSLLTGHRQLLSL